MSLFNGKTMVTTSATTIGHFYHLYCENDIDLDAPYQREYCWTSEQQQMLLSSIFNGIPFGSVSVVEHENEDIFCEVVDGKQRISTIIEFMFDEFPYITDSGEKVRYSQMNPVDQRGFRSVSLSQNQLRSTNNDVVSMADKLVYFLRLNFGGTPQSEKHEDTVRGMLFEASGINSESVVIEVSPEAADRMMKALEDDPEPNELIEEALSRRKDFQKQDNNRVLTGVKDNGCKCKECVCGKK